MVKSSCLKSKSTISKKYEIKILGSKTLCYSLVCSVVSS